jgi:hypothetical protein
MEQSQGISHAQVPVHPLVNYSYSWPWVFVRLVGDSQADAAGVYMAVAALGSMI